MENYIIFVACLFGGSAVILGALTTHALSKKLTHQQLVSIEVGVRYQLFHALLLLFISTSNALSMTTKTITFYLIVVGILFFSGSIYLLNLKQLLPVDFKFLWFITPIGGFLLIAAWFTVAFSILF